MKRKLIIIITTLCITLSIPSFALASVPIPDNICVDSKTTITPYSDNIQWRYKSINGVLYKRLYNYTRKQWIGEWIKC